MTAIRGPRATCRVGWSRQGKKVLTALLRHSRSRRSRPSARYTHRRGRFGALGRTEPINGDDDDFSVTDRDAALSPAVPSPGTDQTPAPVSARRFRADAKPPHHDRAESSTLAGQGSSAGCRLPARICSPIAARSLPAPRCCGRLRYAAGPPRHCCENVSPERGSARIGRAPRRRSESRLSRRWRWHRLRRK